MKKIIFLVMNILISLPVIADVKPAITQPIPIDQIQGYQTYPAVVKKLITEAYQLSKQNLTYQYASANPSNGGMDCSGTIYYLLKLMQVKDVPRQSDEMFTWTQHQGKLFTFDPKKENTFINLKPGDLLFWSGTYSVKRSIPITHVMIYLGKNKDNKPLMFGASDGRTYQNKKMWGVSVFDFKLPNGKNGAKFEGYSCIPELTCDINGVRPDNLTY